MSKIEVNAIEPQSGTTLTLGASGDTVALAAGALQSGFGRTGTVNWDTTKKTTDFTAVNGVGYFCDTTSSAFTVTLPATPTAGNIVAFSDYTGTWGTNNLTIGRNGSNINATATDLSLNTNNTTATLIYVDATEGWRVIDTGSLLDVNSPQYVAATGGTITTCGDYKIHTFTGPGTFTVSSAGNLLGSNLVDYLVVAGGGSGAYSGGGGGGAGGFRESVPSPAAWTASPLANPGGALPVSVQGYPITVGGGGANSTSPSAGNSGSNSIFSTITSAGGGRASSNAPGSPAGLGSAGGSGGGGARDGGQPGFAGNTPPVSPPQGNSGGTTTVGAWRGGGGGGGATAAGQAGSGNGVPAGEVAGNGGAGATTSISGSPTSYAGGGGGAADGQSPSAAGVGGTGGGGQGAISSGPSSPRNASGGSTNTGGGGGGAQCSAPAGSGGSGIVVIRYKFQ